MHPHCIHGSVSALGLSFLNDSKDKRVGLGGTLACGPIQAHVSQRDTAGFRPVQPGSMRSATVPAMLSPAGTHQGHFSRDLIGICFGLLRAGNFDKWSGISSSQLPSFLPSPRLLPVVAQLSIARGVHSIAVSTAA